jgi:hypothetical protein
MHGRCAALHTAVTRLFYTPLLHASFTRLSHMPRLHASLTRLYCLQLEPCPGDVQLCILPCWHIFERFAEYYALLRGYTPLLHDSFTRLFYNYTPLLYASFIRLFYTPFLHASRKVRRLSTPLSRPSLTRLSYTPFLHASITRLS